MQFRSTQALAVTALFAGAAFVAGCQTDPTRSMTYQSPLAAGDDFDEARDRAPSAKTLYRMARLLSSQGKQERALAVLQTSVQRYPDFMPAYSEYAAIMMRQDKNEEAEKILEYALTLAPDDPVVLNNLGMTRMLRENYEGARDPFSRAAALDPNSKLYHANWALSTGMTGRYDESFALYEQIMSIADAHENVAIIAEALDDPDRAFIERQLASGKTMEQIEAEAQARADAAQATHKNN